MKLELTEAQAQKIIDSQNREIAALKLRLQRAHVTMKYLVRSTGVLIRADIERVIRHLEHMIRSDMPSEESEGYQYDHGVLEGLIEQYQALFEDPKWNEYHGISLPILGYLYRFATSGFNDVASRNTEAQVERLMTSYLWVKGEPETPDHFSSNGLDM